MWGHWKYREEIKYCSNNNLFALCARNRLKSLILNIQISQVYEMYISHPCYELLIFTILIFAFRNGHQPFLRLPQRRSVLRQTRFVYLQCVCENSIFMSLEGLPQVLCCFRLAALVIFYERIDSFLCLWVGVSGCSKNGISCLLKVPWLPTCVYFSG